MKTKQNPDCVQLTDRIKIEHVLYDKQSGIWRWAVTVDNRAPEYILSRSDADWFARGVDIGHASDRDLLAALKDVDLRVTQACLASTTVKSKDRSEFLRGELRRIQAEVCAAIAAAQGKE